MYCRRRYEYFLAAVDNYHKCGNIRLHARTTVQGEAEAAGVLLYEPGGAAPFAGPGGAAEGRSVEFIKRDGEAGARGHTPRHGETVQ